MPLGNGTMIFRSLKGLEDILRHSPTHWLMFDEKWAFDAAQGVIQDSLHHATILYQIYAKLGKTYSGRITVPMLWDKKKSTIVLNESSEIIRMLHTAFIILAQRNPTIIQKQSVKRLMRSTDVSTRS